VTSWMAAPTMRSMTGHEPQLCSCGDHELHDVSAIGDWTHGVLGARRSQPKTVRAIAET
jgi:hypothetical protein